MQGEAEQEERGDVHTLLALSCACCVLEMLILLYLCETTSQTIPVGRFGHDSIIVVWWSLMTVSQGQMVGVNEANMSAAPIADPAVNVFV